MSIYSVYFSPTGGTQKCARLISSSFGKYIDVDVTMRKINLELNEKDILILSIPSYAGRCPHIALERIEEIKGNGALAVLVAVYGNRDFDDMIVEMYDFLEPRGFRVAAAMTAIAEHSIVRSIAQGRPDDEDAIKLAGNAKKIIAKLESGDFSTPDLPGNRPYRKTGGHMTPVVDTNCCFCGLCESSCPTGAIRGNEADEDKCIGCMRCIQVCPTGARYIENEKLAPLVDKLSKAASARKEVQLWI